MHQTSHVLQHTDLSSVIALGAVVQGDQLGRQLGFPTANVEVSDPSRLPDDGVYAAWLIRDDGTVLPGAASLGMRPTVVRDGFRILEVHVLDVDGWIDLYGEPVTVRFVQRVRGQVKFDGVQGLVAQIGRDCDRVRRILLRSSSV